MKQTLVSRTFRAALGLSACLLLADISAANAFAQCGKASWYRLTGKTASGERANPSKLTAAHRSLPFGSLVEVTNLANGRSVTVRVNDRGPFARGRIIDVTEAAAIKLGFVNRGVTRVHVRVQESATTNEAKSSTANCD